MSEKHGGFLTAKAISVRIKAKGLQKLKWYCQMCEKQCRDENGFKCHTQSEGHLRQMAVFKSNSGRIMNDFSRDFEREFLYILSKRHGTKRTKANAVYQEVIQERHHIHMNATYWGTLTSFVTYLGQTGKCLIDETEKGWYVQYIDNSNPEYLARQRTLEAKRQHEISDEAIKQKEIERMMKETKDREKELEVENENLKGSGSNGVVGKNFTADELGKVEIKLNNNNGLKVKNKKSKLIDRKSIVNKSSDEKNLKTMSNRGKISDSAKESHRNTNENKNHDRHGLKRSRDSSEERNRDHVFGKDTTSRHRSHERSHGHKRDREAIERNAASAWDKEKKHKPISVAEKLMLEMEERKRRSQQYNNNSNHNRR